MTRQDKSMLDTAALSYAVKRWHFQDHSERRAAQAGFYQGAAQAIAAAGLTPKQIKSVLATLTGQITPPH